jgi:predicted glycoside hydrolase/deacetylase ChbG (UPF0249 family)
MKFLIVNADDFNLTQGISRAVLAAHDRGMVTSTNVMTNLFLSAGLAQALRIRKDLGLGIHLNVTFGMPLTAKRRVRTLVDGEGRFRRPGDFCRRGFHPKELASEYETQIGKFETYFGRLPDHLNTHHHIHETPEVFEVVAGLARKYDLPVRRTNSFGSSASAMALRTTHYLFGSLDPDQHWTWASVETLIKHLPNGVSEMMCHPGFVDHQLKAVSSFALGRACEFRVFSASRWKKLLRRENIALTNFGKLKAVL